MRLFSLCLCDAPRYEAEIERCLDFTTLTPAIEIFEKQTRAGQKRARQDGSVSSGSVRQALSEQGWHAP